MRESDLLINKKSGLNQFFEFSVKVSVFCADMYGVRLKSPANKAPISRGNGPSNSKDAKIKKFMEEKNLCVLTTTLWR